MSMFGKKPQQAERAASAPARGAPLPGGLSIVGAGMVVRGDLESNGVVKVEGVVEGHVQARSQVLVAKEGSVHGDIDTTEAVVGGSVSGSIRATDRVEVQAGASVDGDITTRRISVAEGANLNGLIRMNAAPESAAETPADAKAAGRLAANSGSAQASPVSLTREIVPEAS